MVEVHPSFSVFLDILGVIDQNLMVLDGGGEQDIVSELGKVLMKALDLLGSKELKHPPENGGAIHPSDSDGDWIEKALEAAQVIRQSFSSILFGKFLKNILHTNLSILDQGSHVLQHVLSGGLEDGGVDVLMQFVDEVFRLVDVQVDIVVGNSNFGVTSEAYSPMGLKMTF